MGDGRQRRTWYKQYRRRKLWQAAKPWVIGAAVAVVVIALVLSFTPRTPSIDPALLAEDEAYRSALAQERADEAAAKEKARQEALSVKVERPKDGPLRVLFAGDSITYGLYASEQSKGFRPLMVDAMSKGGPVEEFRGERSGAGAGDVSSILDVPSGLDLAIIELGTNDVGGETPLPEFTKTYGALLDKIRDKSPKVPLLCVGTWGSDGGGYGADPYNDAIEAECTERGGKFASLYDVYPVEANRGPAGREVFGGTSDDFHPNDKGYKAIADLLLSRITISE